MSQVPSQLRSDAAPATINALEKKREMAKEQPLHADTVFSGNTFPKIDLVNRALVEAAVGPVTEKVRFFNAQFNEVTVPSAPGRYGALVEFTAPGALAWTQRLTLFKTATPYFWPDDPYKVTVQFPAAFGIPGDLATKEQWNIQRGVRRVLGAAEGGPDVLAKLLAGLSDIAADPARWQGFSAYFVTFAWWSELGRRIGENQDYKYLSYTPPDYDKDPKKTWPLLIFLHGSGERGDDLNLVKKWGPLASLDKSHPLPMVIIEPQCPEDEWWDPVRLARLLDKMEATYRIDPKRVYFTGLSMGGYGSFEFAATYPDRVAAIAPLSGGEDPALAPRLKKIPAWIFHGAQDTTVPPSESIDLARALEAQGTPVKLTIYSNIGHDKWDVTYRDPALYAWLLAHTK